VHVICGFKLSFFGVHVYSCSDEYEGAYCQVAATQSVVELPLLISLSTLLPVAAILVAVIAIVFIYRRLKTPPDVTTSSRQHRNNVRARYDVY